MIVTWPAELTHGSQDIWMEGNLFVHYLAKQSSGYSPCLGLEEMSPQQAVSSNSLFWVELLCFVVRWVTIPFGCFLYQSTCEYSFPTQIEMKTEKGNKHRVLTFHKVEKMMSYHQNSSKISPENRDTYNQYYDSEALWLRGMGTCQSEVSRLAQRVHRRVPEFWGICPHLQNQKIWEIGSRGFLLRENCVTRADTQSSTLAHMHTY